MHRILLAFAVVLFCCESPEEHSQEASSTKSQNSITEIDLHGVNLDSLSRLDSVLVAFDHSRKQSARYVGYPFLPILEHFIQVYDLDTARAQIVWVCKDGYAPSNSVAEILENGGGFLAFKDLDAPNDEMWTEEMKSAYAPFYLVWENIPYDDHRVAWPYGLDRVRLLANDEAESLKPPDESSLVLGFEKFNLHCQKCHPLNGIGGAMGPEFNRPKNITEYWSRSNIIEFAKNPLAYRENSKMYAISSLSDQEFNAIVDYLEWLAVQ